MTPFGLPHLSGFLLREMKRLNILFCFFWGGVHLAAHFPGSVDTREKLLGFWVSGFTTCRYYERIMSIVYTNTYVVSSISFSRKYEMETI